MLTKIELQTNKGESLVNITDKVRAAIKASGVEEGVCVLYVPHTTAALTINSGMDSNTAVDVLEEVHRLVPTRADFHHIYDTPADAAGHIKAILVGGSQTVIISAGDVLLGSSQSIFFFEFDGPRKRQVYLRIMRDQD
ncbi:MAG: secondary thiamine-phosphate synthase enzyme YjbQ [Chloroflexi bacterium]|nr:secondary thiamine-phosphate synthase enzyme YjbQ [Chloroflexota bacterium]